MATGREMEKALYQGKALREQQETERQRRAHRAALDVLDGAVESCTEAAKARGVSREMVQKAWRAEKERRVKEGK